MLIGIGKAILAGALGMAYSGGLFFIAALYAGFGHGDETPMRLLNMPRGYGLSFFIFAAMAAPFARIRILAAVGATLLSIYFVGLWIEDFSGTIKRFAYGRNSELFVAAICAHLSITATILLYFLWRLFFKRSIPGKTPDAL